MNSPDSTPGPFDVTVPKPDGSIEVFFRPTAKQAEVLPILLSGKYPNVFIYGNRGGGKSHMARHVAHVLALTHPGFKYAILRTSYPELQKTHLNFLPAEMDKLGGEKRGFSYNKTEHIAYYPKGSMGFYAQCATEDDVRKVLGSEFALVIFDEAPTFQFEHMALISASVRVPKGSTFTPLVLYLGNPIGPSINELWARFIDKDVEPEEDPYYNPADWFAFEMRLEDNPHLDSGDYRKRLSSGLLPHYRKAWLEGQRIVEGALFDVKPHHFIDGLPTFDGRPITELPWVQIFRSYDHGFHDPAVCLWFVVFGKRVICFKEMVWTKTPIDVIAKEMKDASRGMRISATYCDPSMHLNDGSVVTKRDSFEVAGIPMDCSVNDRELAATAIHRALNTEVEPGIPQIQILRSACPYLTKSLPKMQFNPKRPEAIADHRHDHPVIALGYMLMSWLPETHPSPLLKQKPWWWKELMGPRRR